MNRSTSTGGGELSARSDSNDSQPDDLPFVPPEPNWLFSNRNYWYPQNQVTDYATARVRLTVPLEYHVVSSGLLDEGSPAAAAAAAVEGSARAIPRVSYAFSTPQPVRYLAVLVSKMSRVDAATVALDIDLRRPRARHARRVDAAAADQPPPCDPDHHAASRRPQHDAAVGGREPAPGNARPRRPRHRRGDPAAVCAACSATCRTAR